MALAAALARVATRLLHGPLPAAAPAAAAVPVFSYRSRLLCGLPATDDPVDPSGDGEAEQWKEAEAAIRRDIEPVVKLVRDILHSRRYGNGGFLSPDDEKVIVEKLLSHHPRAEDKIGCGLDAIMVSVIT
ncbi:hypothetical protein U9M48_029044 [Paspalum notatum var. saurae]|uniref:DCL protein n=1 Tax=Paspalum notatum var. saurae TaxID=547442 RepID=A0AAQ3X1M1_PASNO